MKSLFLFFALLIATVSSQSCNNPLFSGVTCGDDCIGIIDTPTERPAGVTICPDITGQVCCSAETFTAIENFVKTSRDEILAAYAQLKAQLTEVPPISMDAFFPDGCQDSQLGGIITCDQLEAFVNGVANALNTFINSAAENMARCYTSILTYFAGMMCFACDAGWENYIETTGTGFILKLAQNTCDVLVGGCSPLFLSLRTLFQDITAAISTLPQLIQGQVISQGLNPASFANPCGDSDCTNYICLALVYGAAYGDIEIFTPSREVAEPSPAVDVIMKTLAPFAGIKSKVASLGQKINKRDELAVTNSYTTQGGYDASAVGSDSGLQTGVSAEDDGGDGDDGSSASLIASFCLISALFIAAFF